ncbi:tetratricopeptide repeat protein [Mycetocola zhadangensis]|uniref:Co-chaperone YbbN n=1 Tax=Mycetocola zhadangensis TaxID=1164595 RepID=A0A3L7J5B1_9MICO|nr:tetratricopeptide repeat protein [Mycetocola zhadangensis]RLQ85886.1 co-chaperone YbbN [Mycetocola zhadangensis]GGE86680.1 co-chaperone YbbN [Mycetocola zhadangensis]
MSGVQPGPSALNGAALRGAVDLSSLVNRPPAGAQAAATPAPGAPGTPGTVDVPSLVLDGTDENFAQFLEISQQVPVIVDLWAEWCGPCKQLSPVLEKLIAEYGGRLLLVKVDVDANPQLTQAFQAQSIPAVVALIGGRPLQLFAGAIPEQQVREVFEQVLQAAAQTGVVSTAVVAGQPVEEAEPVEPPLPPLHAEAYEAIEAGDYPRAIAAYSKAIAQSPLDKMAIAGLAQVSLLHRLEGKTIEQIRSAAAAQPDDLAAQLDVVDLDLSGGHVEDAFDRLLTLFETADAEERTVIRTRLLDLFEVVGVTDPRVGRARARLTNLLY